MLFGLLLSLIVRQVGFFDDGLAFATVNSTGAACRRKTSWRNEHTVTQSGEMFMRYRLALVQVLSLVTYVRLSNKMEGCRARGPVLGLVYYEHNVI